MENYLRGINPVLHQGTIGGKFDLLVPDMAQVEYEGRVVMVLIADVTEMKVKTIKGDQTAFWTFKGADAAIVRDDDMKDRLIQTLHLDSVTDTPLPFGDVKRGPTMEGVYDDEGAFLGFENVDAENLVTTPRTNGKSTVDEEEEDETDINHGMLTDDEKIILAEVDEQVDAPFVRKTKPRDPTPPPHIRHRDPALEEFLNEPASV